MYTTPLSRSHSQILMSYIMAAWTDTHTQSGGVEFQIDKRNVSNNKSIIKNLKRYNCVNDFVGVHLVFTGVFCSSYRFTVTVWGAGNDEEPQRWYYSATSRLHCWAHFKDQTEWDVTASLGNGLISMSKIWETWWSWSARNTSGEKNMYTFLPHNLHKININNQNWQIQTQYFTKQMNKEKHIKLKIINFKHSATTKKKVKWMKEKVFPQITTKQCNVKKQIQIIMAYNRNMTLYKTEMHF